MSGAPTRPFLRACLEVLAGERSYSYTLDRRRVLLYWGWSSSSTEHAASGGTHMEQWGRGHPPSQPDQPNQPWRSMGWQMSQPDRPHIPTRPFCAHTEMRGQAANCRKLWTQVSVDPSSIGSLCLSQQQNLCYEINLRSSGREGIYIHLWRIHVVWQKAIQQC